MFSRIFLAALSVLCTSAHFLHAMDNQIPNNLIGLYTLVAPYRATIADDGQNVILGAITGESFNVNHYFSVKIGSPSATFSQCTKLSPAELYRLTHSQKPTYPSILLNGASHGLMRADNTLDLIRVMPLLNAENASPQNFLSIKLPDNLEYDDDVKKTLLTPIALADVGTGMPVFTYATSHSREITFVDINAHTSQTLSMPTQIESVHRIAYSSWQEAHRLKVALLTKHTEENSLKNHAVYIMDIERFPNDNLFINKNAQKITLQGHHAVRIGWWSHNGHILLIAYQKSQTPNESASDIITIETWSVGKTFTHLTTDAFRSNLMRDSSPLNVEMDEQSKFLLVSGDITTVSRNDALKHAACSRMNLDTNVATILRNREFMGNRAMRLRANPSFSRLAKDNT